MTKEEGISMKELLLEAREDVKEIRILVTKQEEHLRTMNGRMVKAEEEVRRLNEYKWKLAGALVILSILVPFLFQRLFLS